MSRLQLIRKPAPDSVECLLAPVSAFPVPAAELVPLSQLVLALYDYCSQRAQLESEVFVQVEHLHLAGNAERFASNAAQWLPVLGLGVWPDREPPHSWSREEFEGLQEGQAPRTLMPQIFQVSSNGDSHRHAVESMLGSGTLLCAFAPAPAAKMGEAARAFFLPQIRDPEFRVFRHYFPLMDAATIAAAANHSDYPEAWFCGARLYLRESPEDAGILIASRIPLAPALEAIGARPADGERHHWTIGN